MPTKASYELFPDDLVALVEFHQRTSPAARRQQMGCFGIAFVALLLFQVGVLLTTDKPRLQTAIDIWPLFLGPLLFALFALFVGPHLRWPTRQLSRRLVSEGRNTGFYGQCELAIDTDGLTESRPSGSTIRNWSSVERIATTPTHMFVYTSGVEAFVVPRRAFATEAEFRDFAEAIARNSGVRVDRR